MSRKALIDWHHAHGWYNCSHKSTERLQVEYQAHNKPTVYMQAWDYFFRDSTPLRRMAGCGEVWDMSNEARIPCWKCARKI